MMLPPASRLTRKRMKYALMRTAHLRASHSLTSGPAVFFVLGKKEQYMTENTFARAFRVGIAEPVGSGKTALVDCLSKQLWPTCKLAIVTNASYHNRDTDFLFQARTPPAQT